jgi:hypothetical protein
MLTRLLMNAAARASTRRHEQRPTKGERPAHGARGISRRYCGSRREPNALFSLFTVFVLEYGEDELGFERDEILIAVIVAAAIGLTNLFFGSLFDRVGRKPVHLFGAVLSLVCRSSTSRCSTRSRSRSSCSRPSSA